MGYFWPQEQWFVASSKISKFLLTIFFCCSSIFFWFSAITLSASALLCSSSSWKFHHGNYVNGKPIHNLTWGHAIAEDEKRVFYLKGRKVPPPHPFPHLSVFPGSFCLQQQSLFTQNLSLASTFCAPLPMLPMSSPPMTLWPGLKHTTSSVPIPPIWLPSSAPRINFLQKCLGEKILNGFVCGG